MNEISLTRVPCFRQNKDGSLPCTSGIVF